ncbi:MAG: major facilitator superfamily domain-containing protein [Monoraphidium minutum]|nr:MAG: major facilitator superfamily domain-containing protein [Monoraphidium minutum]
MICAIDRAAISVAILPMSDEYGWSDTTKGAINSAFYAGYTVTNFIGGYLASTVGAKRTLGAGVMVWSFFTMLTPAAAATRSMPALLATRGLMGCGEGTAYPCVQSVVKGWVPPDARSRALTLVYSGGQLGTILALLTAPIIIDHLGWPAVFTVYGSLGLVWLAAWQPLAAAAEADEAALAHGGAAAPLAGASGGGGGGGGVALVSGDDTASAEAMPSFWALPWRRFFTNKPFLGIVAAHSMFGSGHYIIISWLPTFYHQAFDLDVTLSATLSVVPWLAGVVVSAGSGVLADHLMNSGTLDTTATRKLMQTAGSVLPAICLFALAAAQESGLGLGPALALLVGGVALGNFQSAGFASNHQDIAGPRYAPVLFGCTNALSSLVGSASVYATGAMLDAGYSWGAVFQLVALLYLLGAAGYLALGSGERQFE